MIVAIVSRMTRRRFAHYALWSSRRDGRAYRHASDRTKWRIGDLDLSTGKRFH